MDTWTVRRIAGLTAAALLLGSAPAHAQAPLTASPSFQGMCVELLAADARGEGGPEATLDACRGLIEAEREAIQARTKLWTTIADLAAAGDPIPPELLDLMRSSGAAETSVRRASLTAR